MRFKPLLALFDAPHLYACRLDKPFHNERRFIVNAPDTVKHEHKQHVKFFIQCRLLQVKDCVTVLGGNLKPGNAFFLVFLHDFPILPIFHKLLAGSPLHGDVVVVVLADVYLFFGGNPV